MMTDFFWLKLIRNAAFLFLILVVQTLHRKSPKGGVILARIAIATTIFMVFVVSLSPAASSDRNYFSLLIWVAADEGSATVGSV